VMAPPAPAAARAAEPAKPNAQPPAGAIAKKSASNAAAKRPIVRAAPLDLPRLGAVMLAGAWLGGVIFRLWWLQLGEWQLRRLARTARAPGPAALRQFEHCRLASGAGADVQLRIQPAIVSPMYVGAWSNCVLVPEDWETLPEASQRAVLLHE